jgi:hypothetical protein
MKSAPRNFVKSSEYRPLPETNNWLSGIENTGIIVLKLRKPAARRSVSYRRLGPLLTHKKHTNNVQPGSLTKIWKNPNRSIDNNQLC